MSRRILLLKPARQRFYLDAMTPPIGLLSLAAVLRRHGHTVRLLDQRLERLPTRALIDTLEDYRPEVIGVSFLTFELPAAVSSVRWIRAVSPGTPVVIGGPQPTAMPRESLVRTGADAVVVGEGEEVVVPLFEALAERAPPPNLPGVMVRGMEDREVGHAPVPDLANLPNPAWDLVDFEIYSRRRSMSSVSPWRYAPMMTTRGCPWHCTYCHEIHGKRLRKRPLEAIREELDLFRQRLGEGTIEVIDDNLNADPDWACRILELFLQTDGRLRPSFPNGVRSDRVGPELLDLMVRARTAFLSFAIETGDPDMQRRIRKHLDLDAARRAIGEAVRRGIFTNGFFMLGFPEERLDQLLRTIRFAVESPLHMALFFRVVPLPGSTIWRDMLERRPLRLEQLEEDYFLNPINLSGVPDVLMQTVYRFAWLRFYGEPRRLAALFAIHPFKRNLLRRALDLGMVLTCWDREKGSTR